MTTTPTRIIQDEPGLLYTFDVLEPSNSTRVKTNKKAEKIADDWLYKYNAYMKTLSVLREVPEENDAVLVTYALYGEYYN